MDPLFSAAVGSILRFILAIGAGWFVEHGIWTKDAADSYIAGAALGLLSLGWSLWNKYHGRVKFLTALEAPAGTTEAEVKATIASGAGANPLEKK